MTDQELIDATVAMTLEVGTSYTEQNIRDSLAGKTSAELQAIYDKAKRRHEHLFPQKEKIQDDVEVA